MYSFVFPHCSSYTHMFLKQKMIDAGKTIQIFINYTLYFKKYTFNISAFVPPPTIHWTLLHSCIYNMFVYIYILFKQTYRHVLYNNNIIMISWTIIFTGNKPVSTYRFTIDYDQLPPVSIIARPNLPFSPK